VGEMRSYFNGEVGVILCHIHPLLGGDRKIGVCTTAVARQRLAVSRGVVYSARSAKQQLNSNRGTVILYAVHAEVL
jgi:hypothetical protein